MHWDREEAEELHAEEIINTFMPFQPGMVLCIPLH